MQPQASLKTFVVVSEEIFSNAAIFRHQCVIACTFGGTSMVRSSADDSSKADSLESQCMGVNLRRSVACGISGMAP